MDANKLKPQEAIVLGKVNKYLLMYANCTDDELNDLLDIMELPNSCEGLSLWLKEFHVDLVPKYPMVHITSPNHYSLPNISFYYNTQGREWSNFRMLSIAALLVLDYVSERMVNSSSEVPTA